eukprot:14133677-Alexandrium_andersonii.AAC.1
MALAFLASALKCLPARSRRPEQPPPLKTWLPANCCGAQARSERRHACDNLRPGAVPNTTAASS